MTQPDPTDSNAQAGTHPGVRSAAEIAGRISFNTQGKSLKDAATRVLNAAEWSLNSFSDPNRAPKYSIDPGVSYFASGALSLIPRLGKFILSSTVNEPNRGAFGIDHTEGTMYSSMKSTTLGSLDIDTVDGQLLNPMCTMLASTNYSPTKPWLKKLFPTMSAKNLMSISILELVMFTLISALDKNVAKSEKNTERKQGVDMATIIIDNQEIEDQLFGGDTLFPL